MARTIKEIYNEAVRERNKRLELSEFSSDSKLSIMNGLTWAFSAVIYSFEALLDVFAIDISNAINSRINGTPNYYANALLQYQKGDTIKVREDGLAFGYEVIDETKRIITQVSYSESTSDVNLDNKLILKVATGKKGKLSAISAEDLLLVNTYINRIKFMGTRIEVTSLKGDVLIPRVSVYYDGAVLESEIYDLIDEALNEYIMNIEFDAGIYVSKVIETIRKVKHVTDVHIDTSTIPEQGIFVACYDSDGCIGLPEKIDRLIYTNSGYIKESTCAGEEKELPNFRQSIKLIIDKG
ncbi:hypothetical protein IR083_07270 [Dysgonomonas sp. GY75]|uniref:hypothetical protein n=1 Tax=Dysgonomonas sp. GY75 TaxID=2780419 RepID=UPI001884604F|nr:hypothetical protein [Dysgonomonas sp. GY75]MBF0648615.1 hypothetical protein [Dysgonomonas sp. GY75]